MGWMRTRYARLSLRQKFALQLTASVVLLFGALLPSVLFLQERALLGQIRKEGTHLVRLFAFSSVQGIVADDFLLLQGAVQSIASRPDIRAAMLLSLDGLARIHSDPDQVGRVLDDAESLRALRVDAPRVREVLLEGGTRALDFAAPVLVLNSPRAVARLAISLEEPLRGIRDTRNSILLLGALALLAGIGLALIQGRRVALPMQELAEAARELARGKLSRRIPVPSGDELGEVAAAFNKMAESLQALFETSRHLSSSLRLSDVLQAIVRHARELVGSDAAVIAPYDPEEKIATVAASAGSPTPAFMGLRIVLGQGLGGKVLESGEPFVTADYLADSRITHPFDDQVRREGVTAAAALPLLHHGEILGILWVVNRRPVPFTGEQIETLSTLASQAAVAVQNARLYERLRRSHEALVAAQAEQVRSARLAAIGELAAGIAHETRNPLGAISHATETLQRSLRLDGEDAELLEIIRREAGRLNEIVSDFLVFGRPRPLAVQETDLAALIKDVLVALEQDERCHPAVRVETILDPALPRLLLDPHQMSQVLWNLYLNAAQAMPQGGRLLTRARLRPGADGASRLSLEISDTGPGPPRGAEGRLFEPFFTTKPDGTGLGLPIARRIVEEHGGALTLEGGAAGGAVARILLPLREGRADATDPGR